MKEKKIDDIGMDEINALSDAFSNAEVKDSIERLRARIEQYKSQVHLNKTSISSQNFLLLAQKSLLEYKNMSFKSSQKQEPPEDPEAKQSDQPQYSLF